ncbi:autotransporter-associated beta strand repeat-containing protein [Verrucomicrobiaceae bacterium N1E253]|uniref:Autotransporter-associated beta strand repeat-containing protein n=1 Tax=Oceaniferula marina TaxID=2748318 RepID=A0A851GNB0_9BACT|nr:PEP-CTERM sorting domain-containing protein [Oceaniferula marina]NWK56517.1 autotransporter-associated beta strand repeat-containing protein [Oceaniferula marina]
MKKITIPLSMGVSMALTVAQANAQTDVVKDDNGTSLVTGSSWVGGSVPADTDTAVFNDTYTQTGNLGTGAGLTYYGIRLDGVSVTTDVVVNNTTYNNFVSTKEGGIDMSAAVRDLKIVGYVAAGDQEWSLASGRTLTLGGTRFTGTGDVNITGDGTTVINTNGSGAYSGTMTLSGGLLTLNDLDGGNVVVNDAGTLSGEAQLAGDLTLGSSAGATLFADVSTSAAMGVGNLNLVGTNTVSFSSGSTGSVDVLTYANLATGSVANLQVDAASASMYRNAPVLADTGSAITLTFAAGDHVTWTGANDANWDVNTTSNWDNGAATNFYNLDSVIFDDSASVFEIDLVSEVSVGSMTFNNTTAYTIGGGSIAIGSGITASGDVVIVSNLTLSGDRTFSAASGTTLRLGGVISGAGGMEYNGEGTMNLSGRNTFAGGVTVNSGEVILSGGGWYQNPAQGSGMLTVNEGAVVVNWNAHSFGGRDSTSADMTLNGGSFQLRSSTYVDDVWMTGGKVEDYLSNNADFRTRGGGGTVITVEDSAVQSVISTKYNTVGNSTITVNDPDTDFLLSGQITGNKKITKNGVGTLLLTGNNSAYSGAVEIGSGTLKSGDGGTSGGLGSGAVTNNGTLIYNRSDDVTLNGITGGGVITKLGAGLLEVTGDVKSNGDADYITWNFNEGTVAVSKRDQLHDDGIGDFGTVFSFDGGTLLYRNGWNDVGNQDNIGSYKEFQLNDGGGTMSTESAVNVNIDSVVKGTGALTKTGTGTLTLSKVNTYTGNTTVAEGILSLAGSGSIAASSEIEVKAGASFDVSAMSSTFELQNGQTLGGAGAVIGPIQLASGSVIAPGNSAGTMTFDSAMILGVGSTLDFELSGSDQTTGSGINDLMTGVTDLTLDGTLNVAELVADDFLNAEAGDRWVLLEYSGTLTDNGLDLGTLPTLTAGLDFELDLSGGGEVGLVVIPEPSTFTLFGLGAFALIMRRSKN